MLRALEDAIECPCSVKMVPDLIAQEDPPEFSRMYSLLCQDGHMVPSLKFFHILPRIISTIINTHVRHLKLIGACCNYSFWYE